jgi:hypothetical protein
MPLILGNTMVRYLNRVKNEVIHIHLEMFKGGRKKS